jgi:hypothetical protein
VSSQRLLLGSLLTLVANTAAHADSPAPKAFPAAPEHDLVVRVCSGCHVPEMVTAKRHTADEWDEIIGKMVDHGARASEAEQDEILAYLVRFYGKPAQP